MARLSFSRVGAGLVAVFVVVFYGGILAFALLPRRSLPELRLFLVYLMIAYLAAVALMMFSLPAVFALQDLNWLIESRRRWSAAHGLGKVKAFFVSSGLLLGYSLLAYLDWIFGKKGSGVGKRHRR